MAPRTRIAKIGALPLSQFGLLAEVNFQLFWMVTTHKMMELKRNLSLAAYLSARKTYLHRSKEKISSKLAEFMASLTASYCLTFSALKSMFLYSIRAFKLARQRIRFSILSPSFHWNRFSFRRSGSQLVSWKQNHRECPITFQPGLKYEIFSDFQAHLAGLKILARFEKADFSSRWIAPRAKYNLILRGFVSEAGLKFAM